MAGIGPAPFCAMLLVQSGAEVVRIERPGGSDPRTSLAALDRGRFPVHLDAKKPTARDALLSIVDRADVLIEGFRPGVMERLGLGPEVALVRNPRLVYARMTGWGQEGPLAAAPGHDLNYLALTGALACIGPAERPVPPLNLVADFGGGGMFLAFGILCGILEARRTGRGQVVDAAMIDGAAALMTPIYGMRNLGEWIDARESNLLDGAAPFYRTYRCADEKWVAVAAIEEKFHRALLSALEIAPAEFGLQWERDLWPAQREKLARRFAERSREEWCALLEGTDACVSPVLGLEEAPRHAHHRARRTFREGAGGPLPAPAPRFGARAPAEPSPDLGGRADTRGVLSGWGIPAVELDALARAGAI
jgi:alpha-methylacyl-CoA racemase